LTTKKLPDNDIQTTKPRKPKICRKQSLSIIIFSFNVWNRSSMPHKIIFCVQTLVFFIPNKKYFKHWYFKPRNVLPRKIPQIKSLKYVTALKDWRLKKEKPNKKQEKQNKTSKDLVWYYKQFCENVAHILESNKEVSVDKYQHFKLHLVIFC
jgi:hypothetical protein